MLKRTITALVAIPVAFGLIHFGGLQFNVVAIMLAIIGLFEFSNMATFAGYKLYFPSAAVGAVIIGAIPSFGGQAEYLTAGVFAAYLLILLSALYYHADEKALTNMGLSFMATIYVSFGMATLIALRHLPVIGEELLWTALFGTWASDTFAYFVGCAIGKRKLFPAVSPNKSIEGAAAGFVGCVVVVVACLLLWVAPQAGFAGQISVAGAVITAILIALVAPLGDLVESLLKRKFAVKDSGNFFPGHGGVLDRFDSLLFAVPTMYWCAYFLFR